VSEDLRRLLDRLAARIYRWQRIGLRVTRVIAGVEERGRQLDR
jgi:hypothetical protein